MCKLEKNVQRGINHRIQCRTNHIVHIYVAEQLTCRLSHDNQILTLSPLSVVRDSWILGTVTNRLFFLRKFWQIHCHALRNKRNPQIMLSCSWTKHESYIHSIHIQCTYWLIYYYWTYIICPPGSKKYSNTLFMMSTSASWRRATWEHMSAWITYWYNSDKTNIRVWPMPNSAGWLSCSVHEFTTWVGPLNEAHRTF